MDDDTKAQVYAERCLEWVKAIRSRMDKLNTDILGEAPNAEDLPDLYAVSRETMVEIAGLMAMTAWVAKDLSNAFYGIANEPRD